MTSGLATYYSSLPFVTEAVLRKKWKNLRDYFAIEYSKSKKRPAQRSGDGVDSQQRSKWQYFKQLLFLKDIVAPRMSFSSFGNLDSETAEMAANVKDSENTREDQTQSKTPDLQQSSTSSPPELPTTTPQRNKKQSKLNKRKRKSIDPLDKMLKLEDKIELLSKSDDTDDDDLLWLRSLLPYIKRIPEERRLGFRSRIHLILEEYAYGGTTSNSKLVKN